MASLAIFVTLLSLLSTTIGTPTRTPQKRACKPGGVCSGPGVGTPDLSRMCMRQGAGSCNLGAFFSPWNGGNHGWIDWYVFDKDCNRIGGQSKTYPWGSTNGVAPTLGNGWAETVPFSIDSGLPEGPILITDASVPDMFGAGWELGFTYNRHKIGGPNGAPGCACSATPGEGGAAGSSYLSCGCAFPC